MSLILKLDQVSKDLFNIFENEITFANGSTQHSLENRTSEYLRKVAQEAEIGGNINITKQLTPLRETITQNIIPAYIDYKTKTNNIKENARNRKLWKYVACTVGALNIIELLVTKGQSIRPTAFVAALIPETFIGTTIYGFAKLNDKRKIGKAKKQFFKTISNVQNRIDTDRRHTDFTEILGNGEVLDTETHDLIKQYHTPDEFWKEYLIVRENDPASQRSFESLNIPRFDDFLELHLSGTYNCEQREKRLNRLFIKAHEYFANRDPRNYVIKNIRGNK